MAGQANRQSGRDNDVSQGWNDTDRHYDDDRYDYGRSDDQMRNEYRGARQYGQDRGYRNSYEDEQIYGGDREQGRFGRGGYGDYEQRGSGRYGREQYGQSFGRDYASQSGQGGYGQFRSGEQDSRAQYGRFSQTGYGDYGQSGPRQWSQGGEAGADYGSSAEQYMRDTRSGRGHFGKGPKNYTRSDERIREDANDRLMQDDSIDATHIEVQVKDGEVTLSGTVDDRADKRRAEDCVENIGGVKHVQNNIRVADSTDTSASKRTKSSSSQTNH